MQKQSDKLALYGGNFLADNNFIAQFRVGFARERNRVVIGHRDKIEVAATKASGDTAQALSHRQASLLNEYAGQF